MVQGGLVGFKIIIVLNTWTVNGLHLVNPVDCVPHEIFPPCSLSGFESFYMLYNPLVFDGTVEGH
jgi:hypothetical protein